MGKHVLVVSRSDDAADQIGDRLEEEATRDWGDDLLVDYARNRKDAELRVDKTRYDLIISDVELPPDRQSAPAIGKRLGCEFLKCLRDRDIDVPFVLIGTAYDGVVRRDVQTQTDADYVTREEPEWDDLLVKVCRKFITRRALPDRPERLSLELEIILHPAGHYSYRMNVKGAPWAPEHGPLDIDQGLLENLGRRAPQVPTFQKNWERELQDLGETLGKAIFQSNYEFAKKFQNFLGAVGRQKQNVNIRFVIEKDVHPVLLEALKEAGERYWMLEAPVYRRVKEFTDRYALFQDAETRAGPINCLIIQADVGKRVVPKLGRELKPLRNVPEEVKALSTYLDEPENREKFHIGVVKVLDDANGKASFKDEVQDVLKKHKWHVVHYAGHSYYDSEQRRGYVFFPGQEIIPVTVGEFAEWLNVSDVRFLYLSSCHSSEADFVFELANKLVPAVIGFRWDIEDSLAAEYTKCFYEHLFKKMSLEQAFFEARKEMHARHEQDPIWAAPVLVIQAKKE